MIRLAGGPGSAVAAMLLAAVLTITGPAMASSDAEQAAEIVRLLEAGELDAAEAEARQLVERGEQAGAFDLLGVVLGRQGRRAEAERSFRQALERDPRHLGALQHLARHLLGADRDAEALEALRQAAEVGALERDLARHLASAEMAAGDTSGAERQLRSIAGRFESAWALYWLAQIENRRGQPEAARQWLDRGLQLAPNSERLLRAYAQVSMAAQAPVAAIVVLEPLVRMHQTVPEYAYWLGVAMLQLGDLPRAAESLERALPLQEKPARTLLALGLALNKLKHFDRAESALTESLRAEPGNPDAMAALAESKEGLGKLDDAERLARRVLDQAGDHATAHLVIGLVHMKAGEYAAAAAALEAAVAADPEEARGHYQLSLAYSRLGEREKAAAQLEKYQLARELIERRLQQLDRESAPGQKSRPNPQTAAGSPAPKTRPEDREP